MNYFNEFKIISEIQFLPYQKKKKKQIFHN